MDWTHLLNLEFPQLPLDAADEAILKELAHKLQDNYPYHSPDYAGQMKVTRVTKKVVRYCLDR